MITFGEQVNSRNLPSLTYANSPETLPLPRGALAVGLVLRDSLAQGVILGRSTQAPLRPDNDLVPK